MKKLLSFGLTAVMLFTEFSAGFTAFAAKNVSGNFCYALKGGSAEVTGVVDKNAASINIPAKLGKYKVTSIGKSAFEGCEKAAKITMPDSVKKIDDGAFSMCVGMKNIRLSKNLTKIGNAAFYSCISLKSVKLGSKLKAIGKGAFYNCRFKSITIPASVTKIAVGGSDSFEACFNLKEIKVTKGNKSYASKSGVLMSKDKTKLLRFPINAAGSYTVPKSVNTIGSYAFLDARVKSVKIGKNVTDIEKNAFYQSALTSVELPDSITAVKNEAFAWCAKLKTVTLPDTITKIGENAFAGCSELGVDSVFILPESVKTIGRGALSYCPKLTQIEARNKRLFLSQSEVIYIDNSGEKEHMTIYAPKGSNAEQIAAEHGYTFIEI